ncbi:MAG: AraC family transcriptional regulator [Clostridia bacterium]|nr:AraC family transcriptional regulator [Clostridia bacterium]
MSALPNEGYEREAFGARARVLSDSGDVTVYRIECDEGHAQIEDYRLFPGIYLQFNEIFSETLPECALDSSGLLEMNYCAEGVYECEFASGGSASLREGGFSASCPNLRKSASRFPLKRYRGISILLDGERAQRHMDARYPELALRLSDLQQRLCPARRCLSVRASERMRTIFRQLYEVPSCAAEAYYRVKVLELLVLLSALPPCEGACPEYLFAAKKAQMQHIKAHLQRSLGEEITLPQLARMHGVCLSVLKRDFARMYGVSPGAYRRRCRMQAAARLLAETGERVTDVAAQVGYQNVSKFAAAFREELGMSPGEYRRSHGLSEPSPDNCDVLEWRAEAKGVTINDS